MLRVLLTGASGFIGAHVTRALVDAGCQVLAIAVPGDPMQRVQDLLNRIAIVEADLADCGRVRAAVQTFHPEGCIHLAWYAEPGKYLHAPENLAAMQASLDLLRELIAAGCQRVVMTGTCAEYDTDAGFLREEGPVRPVTLYAAAKLATGLIGRQLATAAGIRFAWARIFYPYGPGEDPRRAVPALIRALLRGEEFPATEGAQVRDYIHVEDVAAALWTLLREGADQTVNVCSGTPATMRQIMETVGELTGRPDLIRFGAVPYRDWDPPFIAGDNRRLRALGWRPKYSLREGLHDTIHWWRTRETRGQ